MEKETIQQLHSQLKEEDRKYHEAIYMDRPFAEVKAIQQKIKELKERIASVDAASHSKPA